MRSGATSSTLSKTALISSYVSVPRFLPAASSFLICSSSESCGASAVAAAFLRAGHAGLHPLPFRCPELRRSPSPAGLSFSVRRRVPRVLRAVRPAPARPLRGGGRSVRRPPGIGVRASSRAKRSTTRSSFARRSSESFKRTAPETDASVAAASSSPANTARTSDGCTSERACSRSASQMRRSRGLSKRSDGMRVARTPPTSAGSSRTIASTSRSNDGRSIAAGTMCRDAFASAPRGAKCARVDQQPRARADRRPIGRAGPRRRRASDPAPRAARAGGSSPRPTEPSRRSRPRAAPVDLGVDLHLRRGDRLARAARGTRRRRCGARTRRDPCRRGCAAPTRRRPRREQRRST